MIKRKIEAVGAILALALSISCTENDTLNQNSIELSSQFNFDNSTLIGYNFERAERMEFPSSDDNNPDIIVDQFRLIDGSLKPGFSSPLNSNGFHLMKGFASLEESMQYFNDLVKVDTNIIFHPSSDTVKRYQIWVLKTAKSNYVKLHVSDINELQDGFGKFLVINLNFNYQEDGRPVFHK